MYPSFNARALGLRLSAEETIDLAAEAGFAGVDLLVRDLVDSGADPAALRRRMEDQGLRGGAWPFPFDWRRGEVPTHRVEGVLSRYAEAAAILGLTRTGTWVLPEVIEGAPGDEADARRATREFHRCELGRIARILAEHGTRLGLEVIGVESSRSGGRAPFLCRMADPELGELLRDLDAAIPRPLRERTWWPVGVVVDPFHLYAAGEGIEAALSWGVEGVIWVHVADLPAGAGGERSAIRDRERGLPGESGAVDCRGALRRLAELGYDGPVTVEPLPGCRSLAGQGAGSLARSVARALHAAWPADLIAWNPLSGPTPPRRLPSASGPA
jgi:sugar phosphate isomerase/epimerase